VIDGDVHVWCASLCISLACCISLPVCA